MKLTGTLPIPRSPRAGLGPPGPFAAPAPQDGRALLGDRGGGRHRPCRPDRRAAHLEQALPGLPSYQAGLAIMHTYGNGGDNTPTVAVVTLPATDRVDSPAGRASRSAQSSPRSTPQRSLRVVSYPAVNDPRLISPTGSRDRTRRSPATTRRPRSRWPPGCGQCPVRGHCGRYQSQRSAKRTGQRRPRRVGRAHHRGHRRPCRAGPRLRIVPGRGPSHRCCGVDPRHLPRSSAPSPRSPESANWSSTSVALIGLGVAIDYSLLIVTRWREERDRGRSNDEAVIVAMTTAGRAVLFSGVTVASASSP